MNILIWIIFGAIVGWLASIIMKSNKRGLLRNIIVGLLGSALGGWIASIFNIGSVNTFTFEGFAIATGGAILLIWLLRKL
jgi:uncharacterized membrane protein YeaQ/YmgE (transglycosylase-associated protein family)